MKYFLYSLLVVIIIVTFLSFNNELINIMFSNDSAGYLTEVSNINIIVSVISIIFFYFFIIKKNRYRFFLLFVLMIIWLFSGRRISIRNTEKCRVSSGWFFIETNSFRLCKLADCDCEIVYETTYERLSFWRIRITNNDINKTMFIGPIVWPKVITILENNQLSEFPATTTHQSKPQQKGSKVGNLR